MPELPKFCPDNQESIFHWFALLEKAMFQEERYSFDLSVYQEAEEKLLAHAARVEKVSSDLFRTSVKRFFRALSHSLREDFNRHRWLSHAIRKLRKLYLEKERSTSDEQWLEVIDHYTWFQNNSHCLADVLAVMVFRDAETAWAALIAETIDSGMKKSMPSILYRTLYRKLLLPTVPQRFRELAARRRHLAAIGAAGGA